MFKKRIKKQPKHEHLTRSTNSLVQSHIEVTEGRYYHGIVCFISKPRDRKYFILDSKLGVLSTFSSLTKQKPDTQICVCQCLISLQTESSHLNLDLKNKFDV